MSNRVARQASSKFARGLLLGATMLATGLVPAVASAQEATAPEATGIQDIVVTARKRAETTQDVPVAVTAISPAQIQRYDLTSIEKISASTPELVVGRAPSGSGATLVMRGIGSNTTSIGLEQSVAVVVDGAYYGQGRTINEGFFDLGRLEVLKGPQSLFFGKNATAGLVSITTADPTHKLELIGRLGYEFEGHQILGEAIASGPLSDVLSARIAVRASKQNEGYFAQVGSPQNYIVRDRTSAAAVVNPTTLSSPAAGDGRVKDFYIRGTLKYEPNKQFSATLKANYGSNQIDNPSASSVIYACPTGALAGNPAIACSKGFFSSANQFPLQIAADMPHANKDGALGDQYKSWAVNLAMNYDLGKVALSSVTNYNWNSNAFQFDGDSTSTPPSAALVSNGVFATEYTTYHAFSQELRALSHLDGMLNFMIGGLYQKTRRIYGAWTASGGLQNSLATAPSITFADGSLFPGLSNAAYQYLANSKDSQTRGETLAVFGQIILKPVEQLEITGGLRYTHETKNSYFLQPYSHPIRIAQTVFSSQTTVIANQVFNNTSPEATISYKPNRDINIYASFKTGYKSGGFSNSGILNPGVLKLITGGTVPAVGSTVDASNAPNNGFSFNPETAKGFEGGVKMMLLERQLRLNFDLFTYKYKNVQIDFFNSPVFAFTTLNAATVSTKGAEMQFEYAPNALPGFNLHGSLVYDKAKYDNFVNAPCWSGQTPAQGCTIPTAGALPVQDLSGKPTANAPEWSGSLGVTYEGKLSPSLDYGISVDTRYSSSYISTAFGNSATRQDAYAVLDAAAHIRSADGRWDLAVMGKNLTNRWYVTGGNDAPNTGSGTGTAAGIRADQAGFVSLPRTVKLQVTFSY
ncbi:MAG: TonB-dependent receptor [Sphingomonadales bacterium]|nr:TonB-dependent receptor [Sphingomonadales bacterium]